LPKDVNVPPRRINEIIKCKRAITVDTALRLALFFDMSSSFWLGLQKNYEFDLAKFGLKQKMKQRVYSLYGELQFIIKRIYKI